MSESNKTFIYAVHPRKPITGIPGVPVIRTNKSVYLTKDDVIACLRLAAVFRRFPEKTERVTIDNVDRLHRDSYISEEDWKKMDCKKEDHSSTVPTVTMPETISNAEESLVEDKSEEQVEEAVVENVEETNSLEGDEESQEIDEEATEETVEESDSEEVVEDEVKEEDEESSTEEETAETSEVVTTGDEREPAKDNGAGNYHQKIGQIQYASNHNNKKHNNNKRH